jgi:hypothetical protein
MADPHDRVPSGRDRSDGGDRLPPGHGPLGIASEQHKENIWSPILTTLFGFVLGFFLKELVKTVKK